MYNTLGDYYFHHSNSNFSYISGSPSTYLHPNTLGYARMAQTWYTALHNYLPILKLRIFLQGPYMSAQAMSTSLSRSALTSSPYSEAPKTVSFVPDTVTDWVLLQFRSIYDGSAIASKSCFVSNHGYLFDPDGYSTNISLGSIGISPASYYIVVKHRNHLAIMSNSAVLINGLTKYDFTTGSDQYYGTIAESNKLNSPVVWGMIAGNAIILILVIFRCDYAAIKTA